MIWKITLRKPLSPEQKKTIYNYLLVVVPSSSHLVIWSKVIHASTNCQAQVKTLLNQLGIPIKSVVRIDKRRKRKEAWDVGQTG